MMSLETILIISIFFIFRILTLNEKKNRKRFTQKWINNSNIAWNGAITPRIWHQLFQISSTRRRWPTSHCFVRVSKKDDFRISVEALVNEWGCWKHIKRLCSEGIDEEKGNIKITFMHGHWDFINQLININKLGSWKRKMSRSNM